MLAQGAQPVGAVVVGERNALLHLVDVALGVKVVALDQRQAQRLRQALAHGRLAAAGDPHHDEVQAHEARPRSSMPITSSANAA